MTNRKYTIDARPRRRVRTWLGRVLVLAVAGLVMAGSLAYAAGVEPVRRLVDEFLKGTAGLFNKAESSTREFHLSPNPSGQGVLVMPLDDRGPRAPAGHSARGSGNAKEESSPSGKTKDKSEGDGRDAKKKAADSTVADSEESKTTSDDSKETSSGSASDPGSGDQSEESNVEGSDDSEPGDWEEGLGDSDDDRSGSNSGSDGSDGSDDDRSRSDSGQSDSTSDTD